MSNVICEKCGETALTKCPMTRNVFPDDQLAAIYSNFVSEIETEKSNEVTRYSIKITAYPIDKDNGEMETKEEAIIRMIKGIAKQENIEKIICDHHWLILPGFISGSASAVYSWDDKTEEYKNHVYEIMNKFGVKIKENPLN